MTNPLNIHPKVVGGGVTGLLTLIVLQVLAHYGINVSASVEGEITMGLSVIGGYLTPVLDHEETELEAPK